MLTLYHCHNARSFRPLWTLEEMGLSYELKMLPFPPRDLAPDYLEVNPLGTIPTFLDGSMRMTESAAICQYLVTRYGPSSLAVAPTEPDFGPYLNWLYFGEATLTFPLAVVLRYSRRRTGALTKLRPIIPAGFSLGSAASTRSSQSNRRCALGASRPPTFRSVMLCCSLRSQSSTRSSRRRSPLIGRRSKSGTAFAGRGPSKRLPDGSKVWRTG
jgi:glutathione S-transferase